jgi:hypothetical protein
MPSGADWGSFPTQRRERKLPELPGHGDYRPRLQEIRLDEAPTKLLPDSVRAEMQPGDVRFARTGPGTKVPSSYVVENAALIVTMHWGPEHEDGQREMHTAFLTSLGPRASIDVLEGVIQNIRDICERGNPNN